MDDVRTILIVDDEPHMVRVLAVVLRAAGHRVIVTDDLEEAQLLAEAGTVAAMAIDRHVAGAQSLVVELARNVRTHAVPVVLLTDDPHEESIALPSNVRAVLRKPLSPRRLVEEIAACLGARERRLDAA